MNDKQQQSAQSWKGNNCVWGKIGVCILNLLLANASVCTSVSLLSHIQIILPS